MNIRPRGEPGGWPHRPRFGATAIVALLFLWPAAVSGQDGGQCSSGAEPTGTLGITSFSCHCSFKTDEAGRERNWTFHTEPRVIALARDGVAEGILQEGDQVVAIDGHLITTAAGGARWSDVRPGEAVRLRIRHGERVREVVVRAGVLCPGDAPEPRERESPDRLPRKRLLPRGWLGVGLTCDCSVNAGGDFPLWTFQAPPGVRRVAPQSPASRAGLEPGDRLLRINGARLDTPEGGRAFSLLVPGDTVRFLLEREGRRRTIQLVAAEPPPEGD